MALAATLPRLPGVYFTPPRRERPMLPRLDVAAFVGYAERGPTDLPVPVEDPRQYREVFGGDLRLARDARGEVVYANLPSAVGSFFANGGRRCHVVRVAGRDATPARFVLPGLIAIDAAGDPHESTLEASSVGRWANTLRIATRLRSLPLAAASFQIREDGLDWSVGRETTAIQPGDILRVASGGERWLVLVDAVDTVAGGPRSLIVRTGRTWRLAVTTGSPPEAVVEMLRIGDGPAQPLGVTGELTGDGRTITLALRGPGAGALQAGALRAGAAIIVATPSRRLVLTIATVRSAEESSPPGAGMVEITAGPAVELTPASLPATSPPTGPTSVERLRFEVLIRSADHVRTALTDLAFGPGGPRWWEDLVLPESSPAFRTGAGATAAAESGRGTAAAITAAFRAHRSGARPRDDRGTLADRAVLAADLAPAETSRDGPGGPVAYLPIGLPELVGEGDFVGPVVLGDDDLAIHTAAPFLDARLATVAPGRIVDEAFDQATIRERRLDGIHSIVLVDEVAMLAVPDAAHRPWQLRATALPEAVPPAVPEAIDDPCAPDEAAFEDCIRLPTVASVTPTAGFRSVSTPVLIEGSGFLPGPVSVTFDGLPALGVVVIRDGVLTCRTPPDSSPPSGQRGAVDVSVVNPDGAAVLSDGFVYLVDPGGPELPEQLTVAELDDADLLPLRSIQAALIRLCHGRGDILGLLDLPAHFRVRESLEWQADLRNSLGLARRRGPGDRDLPVDPSYAAVYHPWVIVAPAGAATPLRVTPPDGAIAGLIAARELARGAWIAPANDALRDVQGLSLDLTRDEWATLFPEQLNLIRREAADFRPMSAHTLSDVAELRQISTRRLLMLLRKAALERGMDYVFETNHDRFRQGVAAALAALLRRMNDAGAFAGATPDESFRVDTGPAVNPPEEVDRGRFVAVIQVAPSVPAEFITVALTRTAQGSLQIASV